LLFSFSVNFNFLAIFQVVQCAFLIFLFFQWFRHFFKSSSICFSFSMIISILAIFHVLQWTFLNFPPFSVFLAILHVLKCVFLIFRDFQVSLYSWSYSVHLSFFMFFNISRHISLPNECYSHFPWFSLLSPYSMFYMCTFLIFHVFQWFCHF